MGRSDRKISCKCGGGWGGMEKGLEIKVYMGDRMGGGLEGGVGMVKYEGRGYGKYVVIGDENGLERI